MTPLDSKLEQKDFKRWTAIGAKYGFQGNLGALSTTIWTKGNPNGAVLLISAGVHGPEGLAARWVLNNLLNTGLFNEIPESVQVIVVPDACPDSLVNVNGVKIRTRDIPIYGPDGKPIDAWIDPNRACTAIDNRFWNQIESQSAWIRQVWELLVPETTRTVEEHVLNIRRLREYAMQDLLPTGAPPQMWQHAVLMELIRGQAHDPSGLFYCGSVPNRRQEFNFLRDVLVPELGQIIGDRPWRGVDIHTGLPNSIFLIGNAAIIRNTANDLEVPLGGPPKPESLFGEICMVIPNQGGGDFLGALAERCPSVMSAFGLEYTQADGHYPWSPYPGATAPMMPMITNGDNPMAKITAEHFTNFREKNPGQSEVDSMIRIAVARRMGWQPALCNALQDSERYFSFGAGTPDENSDHLMRMKRYVHMAVRHHLTAM